MKYIALIFAFSLLAGCEWDGSNPSRGLDKAKDTRLHWDSKWEAQGICARNNMLFESSTFLRGDNGGYRAICRQKDGSVVNLERNAHP